VPLVDSKVGHADIVKFAIEQQIRDAAAERARQNAKFTR
jgi:hypothetical protein